jgi:hypothetical protein
MIKKNILSDNLLEFFKNKEIDILKNNLGIIVNDYMQSHQKSFLDTYITIMHNNVY